MDRSDIKVVHYVSREDVCRLFKLARLGSGPWEIAKLDQEHLICAVFEQVNEKL